MYQPPKDTKYYKSRKLLRLQGFDYGSNGGYFITINTKNRELFFGKIKNGIMGLSEIGCLTWKCWYEIPKYYPFVILDEFVVMPDHVHGVLFINKEPHVSNYTATREGGATGKNNPMGKGTLGEIIRYYKGRLSFEVHQNITPNFAWLRRFHDHIIRSEDELNRIRQYVRNNPENWGEDDANYY